MSEKLHFLEVNRGRYLCSMHGGFCDSSDSYQSKCPACSTDKSIGGSDGPLSVASINYVDRVLQIIGNLQQRSLRSVQLITALFGGIAIIELTGNRAQLVGTGALEVSGFIVFAACLLIALLFYSVSIRHIPVTNDGSLECHTLIEWERKFSLELSNLEWWHRWAGRIFAVAIGSFVFALLSRFWPSLKSFLLGLLQ